jgi:hypothetical protein
MGIQWSDLHLVSDMTMKVKDNDGDDSTVLEAALPFDVNLHWEIPATLAPSLGGNFRLRVYAESIGPGPETQIGPTMFPPVVGGQTSYDSVVTIPANSLPGEGATDSSGTIVSGVYKLIAVLQHLNPGPNDNSGYAESVTLIQLRTP